MTRTGMTPTLTYYVEFNQLAVSAITTNVSSLAVVRVVDEFRRNGTWQGGTV